MSHMTRRLPGARGKPGTTAQSFELAGCERPPRAGFQLTELDATKPVAVAVAVDPLGEGKRRIRQSRGQLGVGQQQFEAPAPTLTREHRVQHPGVDERDGLPRLPAAARTYVPYPPYPPLCLRGVPPKLNITQEAEGRGREYIFAEMDIWGRYLQLKKNE